MMKKLDLGFKFNFKDILGQAFLVYRKYPIFMFLDVALLSFLIFWLTL